MLITVKVISGSKQIQVTKIDEKSYRVKLTAKREKGKANKQLIKVLAEYFDKPKRVVEIKQGLKSNNKVVEIKI